MTAPDEPPKPVPVAAIEYEQRRHLPVSGLAIASLVLSLLPLTTSCVGAFGGWIVPRWFVSVVWVVVPLAGFACGAAALPDIMRGQRGGLGLAVAGITITGIFLTAATLVIVFGVGRP